jgi:hypothetical protein
MKELCPRKDTPLLGLPAQAGTSGPHPSQNFRLKLKLSTRIRAGTFSKPNKKGLFGYGLLDSDLNYSKLVENLKNKPWRGFLLG